MFSGPIITYFLAFSLFFHIPKNFPSYQQYFSKIFPRDLYPCPGIQSVHSAGCPVVPGLRVVPLWPQMSNLTDMLPVQLSITWVGFHPTIGQHTSTQMRNILVLVPAFIGKIINIFGSFISNQNIIINNHKHLKRFNDFFEIIMYMVSELKCLHF